MKMGAALARKDRREHKSSLAPFLALLLSAPALAQEEDWTPPPFPAREAPAADDSASLPPPPLLGDEPTEAEPAPAADDYRFPPLPPPPPPIEVRSLYGARALGKQRQAISAEAGFPFIGLRYARGLTDRLDLGVRVESFYGMSAKGALDLRWEPLRAGLFSLATVASAGGNWFLRDAQTDLAGARSLTGERNLAADAGLVLSVASENGRGLAPFLDARYQLTADFEAFQVDPLGGVPPPVDLANNLRFRIGAELGVSSRTALVGSLGLDFHGRRLDSPVLFTFSLGLIAAL